MVGWLWKRREHPAACGRCEAPLHARCPHCRKKLFTFGHFCDACGGVVYAARDSQLRFIEPTRDSHIPPEARAELAAARMDTADLLLVRMEELRLRLRQHPAHRLAVALHGAFRSIAEGASRGEVGPRVAAALREHPLSDDDAATAVDTDLEAAMQRGLTGWFDILSERIDAKEPLAKVVERAETRIGDARKVLAGALGERGDAIEALAPVQAELLEQLEAYELAVTDSEELASGGGAVALAENVAFGQWFVDGDAPKPAREQSDGEEEDDSEPAGADAPEPADVGFHRALYDFFAALAVHITLTEQKVETLLERAARDAAALQEEAFGVAGSRAVAGWDPAPFRQALRASFVDPGDGEGQAPRSILDSLVARGIPTRAQQNLEGMLRASS